MTNGIRKITALTLAFMMVFVSVFGSGSFVYADGGEDAGIGSGKEISNAELDIDTERVNEYYPASFKYAVQNMDLDVWFADGTAETVSHWFANNGGYDGTDYAFVAYGNSSHDQYFMRFYRVDAGVSTQMKFCDTEVPIGTFTVFITRNEETNPIEVVSIKINDPKARQQDASGTTAGFASNDTWMYEETWYPLNNLTPGKEYVFNVKDWTESNGSFFAGIWYRDDIDKAVYNLDVGFQYGTIGSNFTYQAIANETPYLVIGEVYQSGDQSGTISWQEKRTLKSIELNPAASYMPWKHDIETMPLKLTYTDGTTATESNWMQTSFDQPGSYNYVEGYAMTTSNGDIIRLAKYVDGAWQAADHYGLFTPGSFNWRAFAADNTNIYDDATVKVVSPSVKNLKLEDGYAEDFSISASTSAAYTYTPTKPQQMQVINNGQKSIVAYTYFLQEGTNSWQYTHGRLVHSKNHSTFSVTPGSTYMTILSCEEGSTSGSIGLYSVGSTKSATIPTTTIQQDDYTAWTKLPITFNFTSPEGVSVGSQTIANWSAYYGYDGAGYAETKYDEVVFYQVYKDGKLVEVPFISEEMLAVLNDQTDDEIKNLILLECGFEGGVEGLKLAVGTYTVKVYLNRIDDSTLIGTGTVKVAAAGCTTHTWNSGKVTKKATCTAAGSKTFTCTKCGETKKETIQKLGHSYSSKYTVDKKATTSANGSKSKHCTRCDATTSKKTIYKASSFKFSTSTYTYNGKAKSPTITIKDSKGNNISTSNYSVKKLTSRKNVGKHGYKITFKNQYKGTKTVYFTINPKSTSISKVTAEKKGFTVKWNKVTSQASGYEVMYATNSKFTKNKKTVKVTSYKTTSKKVTKLKAKTKYYVKVRTYKTVDGKKYYSAWSKAKTVTTKK